MTILRVSIETVASDESSVLLALRGEFDLENVSILRIALADHINRGRCVIRLDMSGVEYMDSTTMGAFVEARQACHDKGGALILTRAPDRVRQVLRMGGLDGLLADSADSQA
ncbi:MAG: STAS domain-containing protein [Mycobacterium sp.]|nr:STAS domain-containing protein [Mycobacterium sp.]